MKDKKSTIEKSSCKTIRVPVDYTKLTEEAWDYKLSANCGVYFLNTGEYKDIEFKCKDCRKTEIWTGEQQKWWYEEAKGNHFTTATRCRSCRKSKKESYQGGVINSESLRSSP